MIVMFPATRVSKSTEGCIPNKRGLEEQVYTRYGAEKERAASRLASSILRKLS